MRLLWVTLFAGFTILNLYALASDGPVQLLAYLGRLGAWGIVATVDLIIALLISITWTYRDARSRGISAIPFIALTLLTGSLGVLLYLAIYSGQSASSAERSPITSGDEAPRTGQHWAAGEG
jgi:hypothetical protein